MTKLELDRLLTELDLNEPEHGVPYEFISFRISKEVYEKIKPIKDSKELQELLIRRYITNNFGLVEDYVVGLSDLQIRYEAHMLTLKDTLKKLDEKYEEQLTSLCEVLYSKQDQINEKLFKPMDKEFQRVNKLLDDLRTKVDVTKGKVSELPNTYVLTEIVRIAESWSQLSQEAKSLLSPLFSSSEESKDS